MCATRPDSAHALPCLAEPCRALPRRAQPRFVLRGRSGLEPECPLAAQVCSQFNSRPSNEVAAYRHTQTIMQEVEFVRHMPNVCRFEETKTGGGKTTKNN